jgi:hypothetical protein
LESARTQIARLEHELQKADQAPTTPQVNAVKASLAPIDALLAQWEQMKTTELKALNEQLVKDHLQALQLNTFRIDHDVEDQIQVGLED